MLEIARSFFFYSTSVLLSRSGRSGKGPGEGSGEGRQTGTLSVAWRPGARGCLRRGSVDVGICLPYMERDLSRERLLAWCRSIEEGPFSSLSCGERITGYTIEMRTALGAAAAVTDRVRIVPSLYVLPMHSAVCRRCLSDVRKLASVHHLVACRTPSCRRG